jgi:hypothetical protein
MSSYYEIGGLILSGAELENAYADRSALEKKQRSEDIKLMHNVKLPKGEFGRQKPMAEKDSLVEHWAKMITMPARRGLSDVPEIISLRRSPRMLGAWGIQVYLDMIEANYQYFIQGETIEQW